MCWLSYQVQLHVRLCSCPLRDPGMPGLAHYIPPSKRRLLVRGTPRGAEPPHNCYVTVRVFCGKEFCLVPSSHMLPFLSPNPPAFVCGSNAFL